MVLTKIDLLAGYVLGAEVTLEEADKQIGTFPNDYSIEDWRGKSIMLTTNDDARYGFKLPLGDGVRIFRDREDPGIFIFVMGNGQVFSHDGLGWAEEKFSSYWEPQKGREEL